MRDAAVTIVVALIGAGLLDIVRTSLKTLRKRWAESTPERQSRVALGDDLANADKSALILLRNQTGLEQTIQGLRDERAEQDRRHALDRQEWERRERELLTRLNELEVKVRALLDELMELKTRHEPA